MDRRTDRRIDGQGNYYGLCWINPGSKIIFPNKHTNNLGFEVRNACHCSISLFMKISFEEQAYLS